LIAQRLPLVLLFRWRLTFALSVSKRGRQAWNLVISNVPGPQFPLYMAGARLQAQYPISVITDGMGLNITVMSYCGHLDVGLVADREQMPNLWRLMDWVREALAELSSSHDEPAKAPRASDGDVAAPRQVVPAAEKSPRRDG
jgi:diacylglycerol O-acyltransferase / wax synthase